MKANTKKFDCVEMMHKGAKIIQQETLGMTKQEKLIYWQKQNKIFEHKYNLLLREKQKKYSSCEK